ncbi:MAG: 1-deoxy-D-xylulose-5-phosphate reductoisomerase [Clostridia bacterium]|nr:1-deoxy-D-xylulose-5-phosphate reductoisomerase [Clostridia bacterium]
MKKQQLVTVMGSTGSIGRQALDVIALHPDRFSVFALCAGRNIDLLLEQANRFRPRFVTAEADFDVSLLPEGTLRLAGPDAVEQIASMEEPDVVVGGISGIAQLKPLLCALKANKRVALANKESIVCAHELVDACLASGKGELIPVDSEQSAIFQCLAGEQVREVRRVLLTASGGPFWQLSREELGDITVEQALKHPTWNMGKKITIDSATLFNKGLEFMEACYLFHLPPEKIQVVIHPQSIVHSAVEYHDGTILANISHADMRIPIQYAMTYPERIVSPAEPLPLEKMVGLTFYPASFERFASLQMAFDCAKAGGSAPIVYNGANEAAVALFFERRLGFAKIESAVAYALDHHPFSNPTCLEEILEVDRVSRELVLDFANHR